MGDCYVIYEAFRFVNSIFGEFVQILFHFLWSNFVVVVVTLLNCLLCLLNDELILNGIVSNGAGCWLLVSNVRKKKKPALRFIELQNYRIFFSVRENEPSAKNT